jgi:hypothetical protein
MVLSGVRFPGWALLLSPLKGVLTVARFNRTRSKFAYVGSFVQRVRKVFVPIETISLDELLTMQFAY